MRNLFGKPKNKNNSLLLMTATLASLYGGLLCFFMLTYFCKAYNVNLPHGYREWSIVAVQSCLPIIWLGEHEDYGHMHACAVEMEMVAPQDDHAIMGCKVFFDRYVYCMFPCRVKWLANESKCIVHGIKVYIIRGAANHDSSQLAVCIHTTYHTVSMVLCGLHRYRKRVLIDTTQDILDKPGRNSDPGWREKKWK